MDEFAGHINQWHEFYALAGGMAATLLGLLFVGVSLQSRFRTAPPDSYVRTIAGQSFQSFLLVILYSLYFLMPDPTPGGIAWPVILTALTVLAFHLRVAIRQVQMFSDDRESYFWHFVVPGVCYIAATLVGVALLRGANDAMDWMVPVTSFLIVIPTRNSWEMLIKDESIDRD